MIRMLCDLKQQASDFPGCDQVAAVRHERCVLAILVDDQAEMMLALHDRLGHPL